MKRKNHGFSIYELMVVIAIMGIIAAIAVPSFLINKESRFIRGYADNLVADMQLARMQALRSGRVSVVFQQNSYKIFTDADGNYEVNDRDETIRSVSFIKTVKSSNTFGSSRLQFDNKGMASAIGTVTISGNRGKDKKKITVNRIGKVWLEK